MKGDFPAIKKQLRQQLRAGIQTLSAFQREEASAQACALLQAQPIWKNVRTILFYAPLPSELNIWALVPEALASGKIVLLPKFDPAPNSYSIWRIKNIDTDLLPGRFGINEPSQNCSPFALNQLDLSLIPGIGFDLRGGRLGRGGGFYDRLLAQVSGIKCGVAFDEQIAAEIPVEPHDIRLDCILTPTRWLAASGRVV